MRLSGGGKEGTICIDTVANQHLHLILILVMINIVLSVFFLSCLACIVHF